MGKILNYQSYTPQIEGEVFIAETAQIIGKVIIKSNVSIWYNSILRGDVGSIIVDKGTNIQDGTIIHVDRNAGDTIIGKMVTIGHGCILHACTINDYSFIGMGAMIMDRAVIEQYSMVGAGSLVTPGKQVKRGQLWVGRPAKYMRDLTSEEIEHIKTSADNYIRLSQEYLK